MAETEVTQRTIGLETKLEVLGYGGKKLIECDRRMAPQVISDIYSAHKDRFSR